MVRSSCGRFSCIRFIKSRNLVRVSAVVAICCRKLAMMDYIRRGRGGSGQRTLGRCLDYSAARLSPLTTCRDKLPQPPLDADDWCNLLHEVNGLSLEAL